MSSDCLVQDPITGSCLLKAPSPPKLPDGLSGSIGVDGIKIVKNILDGAANQGNVKDRFGETVDQFSTGFGQNLQGNFGSKDKFYNTPIGGIVRGVDELFGEITGRNQGREALFQAELRRQQEAIARDKGLKDEQMRRQQEDIAASMAADVARKGSGRGRSNLSYQDSPLANKDFLGL